LNTSGLSGDLGPDTDADGDALTYGIQGGTDNGDGTVSLEGDFGTLTVNTTTGAYSYVPNELIETLDDGEAAIDTFTVTVSDGINPPVSQTLAVNLTGADDPPTLTPVTSGSIAELAESTTVEELGLSGTLAGDDVDAGDTLTYGIIGEGVVTNEDGTVSLAGTYGTLTVNTSTGAYSYAPDYAAIEALNDGDTPIDQFTVTVSDGDGPPVSQIYTVNLTGSTDAPDDINPTVVSVEVSDTLITDANDEGTFTVTVAFSEAMDTEVNPTLTFDPDVAGTLGFDNGQWSEDGTTYTATYDVLDTNVDLADVTIDVEGAQDANGNAQQDYTPEAEFSIDTVNPTVVSVEVSDTLISVAKVYGTFTLSF
jgi:VCBS repeat-containing protein